MASRLCLCVYEVGKDQLKRCSRAARRRLDALAGMDDDSLRDWIVRMGRKCHDSLLIKTMCEDLRIAMFARVRA